jgi:hypothetical protein
MTAEANVFACGLAVVVQVIALYGVKSFRGTTLVAPCLWVAIAASCLLILALVQIESAGGLALSVLRFAVAAMTLCPLIAVLGAKRPQDRGWQWVVGALWLILIWPAAQTLANPAGPEFEIFLPWKIFIVALIAMGPLNYLPTRHWLASLFVAGGQFLMFSKFLGIEQPEAWLAVATFCFCVASLLVLIRHKSHAPTNATLPLQTDRWLGFRDAYGAFWGLRIMQRVNETAALRNWPVELTWSGFGKVNSVAGLSEAGEPRSETSATIVTEIDQTLNTLLRRFL